MFVFYKLVSVFYSDVLTSLEWDNERLVKDVRQQMKSSGTTNPGGRSIEDAMLENDSIILDDGGVDLNEGFPCLVEGWAYVDVSNSDVGTIRGFIPFSCIAPE